MTISESIRRYSPFVHMMRNPHYYSGAIVARASTYFATLVWGVYVSYDSIDGIIDGAEIPPYPLMVTILPIWGWGLIAVAAAGVQLARLIAYSKPSFAGTIINALHCFFWVFVAISRIGYSGPGTACIVVIAVLSLSAFISSPHGGQTSAGE